METPLRSRHSIPRSDETWLPEWSGNLAGVQRCAVRSRGVSWSKPVFWLTVPVRWPKVWRGGRVDFDATERAQSGTEARLTRNAGGEGWSRFPQIPSNGTKWKTANKNEGSGNFF